MGTIISRASGASRRGWTAAALTATLTSAWLAASAPLGLDYAHDAGPPIQALLELDGGRFLQAQPLMGSFSVLVRAPFAALAAGGELAIYRLGAFPCLLAAAALAVWLASLMRAGGRPPLACGIVVVACLVNPMTFDALRWGHPEELLGGALCVGAALAALGRRALLAGALLGLALATKQWALLAAMPVLLVAAPPDRMRLALLAGVVAAALTLPLAAGSPGAFVGTNVMAATTPGKVSPASAWWPFASQRRQHVFDGVEQTVVTSRFLPGPLPRVPHALIVVIALALSALLLRRGTLASERALALLALVFLMRGVLDPVNIGYYHIPFLMSLAAWEGLRSQQLPIVTLSAVTALWLTFEQVARLQQPALTNAVYLAWTLPLAALLAFITYRAGPIRKPSLFRPR